MLQGQRLWRPSAYGAIAKSWGQSPITAFNGQRKSLEIGVDTQTAEFWEYNGDVGRRANVDPITKDDESAYFTFGGNPIVMIDPDGDDWYKDTKGENKGQVIWKEGSEKHKGYKRLGKTYDGNTNERGKDKWMNGDANGKKVVWEETVYVQCGEKKPEHTSTSLAKSSVLNNFVTYDRKLSDEWSEQRSQYKRQRTEGATSEQASTGLPGERIRSFEKSWQADQDYRATSYALLDFATIFVPVPKVGMMRWFGKATGRVFWSGGGVTGKAFASATEHAFLYGGTTLERTITGKSITFLQNRIGQNAMTGRLWKWASTRFAKGAVGGVDVFLGTVRSDAFWYTEKAILENSEKVRGITTHLIP